jgi:hypothetical protein
MSPTPLCVSRPTAGWVPVSMQCDMRSGSSLPDLGSKICWLSTPFQVAEAPNCSFEGGDITVFHL